MSATWAQACEIALNYPEIEVTVAYGTPALRAGKRFMGRLREDGDTLILHTDEMARDMLLQAEPDIFYLPENFTNTPYIMIRLSQIHPDDLRDHIEQAWRKLSTKRAIKTYEAKK